MSARDRAPLASYALALTGFASLLPVFGISRPLVLTGMGLLAAWAFLERRMSARIPRGVARAVDLLTVTTILLFAAATFSLGRTSLLTLGHVLVLAQLSRAFRRKRPRDLAILNGGALAQTALAAFLTRDPLYLPILLAVVVLGVMASLRSPSHPGGGTGDLRIFVARPRGRAGLRARAGNLLLPAVLSLAVLATGAALFVFLPRGRQFDGMLPEPEMALRDVDDPTDYSKDVEEGEELVVGFTERVRLGQVGRIKAVPRPAFLVKTSVAGRPRRLDPAARYFRGVTLDTFDGKAWGRSPVIRGRDVFLVPRGGPGDVAIWKALVGGKEGCLLVAQEYELAPTTSSSLLALGQVVKIRLTPALPRVRRKEGGCFSAPRPHRKPTTYLLSGLVRSSDPWRPAVAEDLPRGLREVYLDLPSDMERVVAAAREVAGEGTALERADRITRWLRERCEYTLLFEKHPQGNAVDDFLFESRVGHCEYFATALALMLRAVDVPTRLVAGYRGGVWLEDRRAYYLTMADAHAWVEAYVAGMGWVRLDPTPGDEEAVSVPPSELPGVFDQDDLRALAARLMGAVRDFGPEERDELLTAAERGVGFVLREGLGLGREDRPYPPPLLMVLMAVVAGGLALRLLRVLPRRGRRARGAEKGRVMRPPPEVPFYQEAVRALAKAGIARARNQSAREFAEVVRRQAGARGEPFGRLTRTFEEVRYGGRRLGAEESSEIEAITRRFVLSLAEEPGTQS